MKVGSKIGQNSTPVESTQNSKVDGAAKGKSNKSSASSLSELGGAKVNLSSRAQSMQRAKDIASADTVDEAKVARLQKMIDEGKYRVDSRAVADRLVDEHLAMSDFDE